MRPYTATATQIRTFYRHMRQSQEMIRQQQQQVLLFVGEEEGLFLILASRSLALANYFLKKGIQQVYRFEPIQHPPRTHFSLSISLLAPGASLFWCRLKPHHLHEIYVNLRFPYLLNIQGRSVKSEWAFVVFMARMCQGQPFEAMVWHFGRDPTQLQRIFTVVLNFVWELWAEPMLRLGLSLFSDRLPEYAAAVQTKVLSNGRRVNELAMMAEANGEIVPDFTHVDLNPDHLPLVAGFMDGIVVKGTNPGAGPVEPGVEAERHPFWKELNRSFYSHAKHTCGLRYVTIMMADGTTVFCSKCFSARNNDSRIVLDTGVDYALQLVQPEEPKIGVYADTAFARSQCVHKKHRAATNVQLMQALCFNQCRTSVEHSYAYARKKCKLLRNWFSMSLKSRNTQLYLPMALFLCNLFNCVSDNQTAKYYKCKPCTVAEYLSLLDEHEHVH